MTSASALRTQIETALSERIPSALTPLSRTVRPMAPTGIATLDELLKGGLPLGAITEIVGEESTGKTSLTLSFIAKMTQAGRVCAWVDASDALDPESAAALGVDLSRLLWVRCGASESSTSLSTPAKFELPEKYLTPPAHRKGLHGGGHGPHPRTEIKGMSNAVGDFLKPGKNNANLGESQHGVKSNLPVSDANVQPLRPTVRVNSSSAKQTYTSSPWPRIEQALRVTDLLLQTGGFSSIVLDLGSLAPEYVSRVPLATWFRYRAAAERTQASFLLLTQHACAKSSAGLILRMQQSMPLESDATVFNGFVHAVEIQRERFSPVSTNVIPLRKPPQRAFGSEHEVTWQSRTPWVSRA